MVSGRDGIWSRPVRRGGGFVETMGIRTSAHTRILYNIYIYYIYPVQKRNRRGRSGETTILD